MRGEAGEGLRALVRGRRESPEAIVARLVLAEAERDPILEERALVVTAPTGSVGRICVRCGATFLAPAGYRGRPRTRCAGCRV